MVYKGLSPLTFRLFFPCLLAIIVLYLLECSWFYNGSNKCKSRINFLNAVILIWVQFLMHWRYNVTLTVQSSSYIVTLSTFQHSWITLWNLKHPSMTCMLKVSSNSLDLSEGIYLGFSCADEHSVNIVHPARPRPKSAPWPDGSAGKNSALANELDPGGQGRKLTRASSAASTSLAVEALSLLEGRQDVLEKENGALRAEMAVLRGIIEWLF